MEQDLIDFESALFYSDASDIEGWSPKVKMVTRKSYMQDYPEVRSVYPLKKYGFNLKSQLLKLFVIFPAASALAAWVCAQLV